MKTEAGPLFGALIIGCGLAYLVHRRTQNLLLAIGAGIAVALADYFFLLWIDSFKKKK